MIPTNPGSARRWALLVLVAAACGVACEHIDTQSPGDLPPAAATSSSVFTPAHQTFAGAVRDFFGIRPTPRQPIPFPHKTHIAKGLGCTDYCHEGATKGPIAGLPSVKTCMICHDAIATDRPLIQTVTKQYAERKLDLPWQRVYGYAPQAHVRFNHAPHIRAKVECSTCHGHVAEQTVAERNVDLNMGFCVDCHRQKEVSVDCLTCHF